MSTKIYGASDDLIEFEDNIYSNNPETIMNNTTQNPPIEAWNRVGQVLGGAFRANDHIMLDWATVGLYLKISNNEREKLDRYEKWFNDNATILAVHGIGGFKFED